MKKIGIILLVVVAGVFLLRKTHFASYVRTAWAKVKHGAKNQVPLEFEVERVRNEIARLDDDMRGQLGPIAEEMATVKMLRRRIETARQNLKDQKADILVLTKKLESGEKEISFNEDEVYTPEEARAKLDRDFASYKRCAAEVKSQEKLLAAKEQSLKTVRTQLATMKTLKRDLEVQLAQLEAELKSVRLAQTRDKYQMDDSRLSDIKSSLAEIEHRLEAERARVDLNGQLNSKPFRSHKKVRPVSDLTREVKNYFGEKTPAGEDKVEKVSK
jgi:chromosome segregation ATPase